MVRGSCPASFALPCVKFTLHALDEQNPASIQGITTGGGGALEVPGGNAARAPTSVFSVSQPRKGFLDAMEKGNEFIPSDHQEDVTCKPTGFVWSLQAEADNQPLRGRRSLTPGESLRRQTPARIVLFK